MITLYDNDFYYCRCFSATISIVITINIVIILAVSIAIVISLAKTTVGNRLLMLLMPQV